MPDNNITLENSVVFERGDEEYRLKMYEFARKSLSESSPTIIMDNSGDLYDRIRGDQEYEVLELCDGTYSMNLIRHLSPIQVRDLILDLNLTDKSDCMSPQFIYLAALLSYFHDKVFDTKMYTLKNIASITGDWGKMCHLGKVIGSKKQVVDTIIQNEVLAEKEQHPEVYSSLDGSVDEKKVTEKIAWLQNQVTQGLRWIQDFSRIDAEYLDELTDTAASLFSFWEQQTPEVKASFYDLSGELIDFDQHLVIKSGRFDPVVRAYIKKALLVRLYQETKAISAVVDQYRDLVKERDTETMQASKHAVMIFEM